MIRASGGRAAVKVKKEKVRRPGTMHHFLQESLGAWCWEVPAPKGHPRTPKLESLRGREHGMEEAVAAGLARLNQIYGEAL